MVFKQVNPTIVTVNSPATGFNSVQSEFCILVINLTAIDINNLDSSLRQTPTAI